MRWLSLGNVFHRVWELKGEIATFLNMIGKTDDFPELQDTEWLADLAFDVDTLRHLNDLNLRLQGKDVFVHELYSNVKAFKAKHVLFSRQISSRDFSHFPTLTGVSTPITMGVTTIYFGGDVSPPMLEKYQSVPPNNRPIIL